MFESDAENEFESQLEPMVPGDRAVMMRRLSMIAAHFDAAMVAGIERMIADRNPELKAQAWDVAQAVIQTAKGCGVGANPRSLVNCPTLNGLTLWSA